MKQIVVLLAASVALQGAIGVFAAPDFVSISPSSVMTGPLIHDPGAARLNQQAPRNLRPSTLDLSLLPKLGGQALLKQLPGLDRTQLESFVESNPQSVRQLLLDPPAASRTAQWWNSLNPDARQELRAAAPGITGNLPGVPFTTRNSANRALLGQTIADLEAQADSVVGRSEATGIAARLSMLRQIELAVEQRSDEPARSIIGLDTEGQGRAVVVIGDIMTADYVSYLIPGMFFTIEGQVVDWSQTALDLYNEQVEWLDRLGEADPQLRGATVATVAWMGYQTPNLFSVGSQELADDGALYLDSSMDALYEQRGADRPFVTLLAHSYGSTAAMKSLVTGNFDVDSFAVVGSPGSAAQSVDDLHVRGRNVFVGEASWDPVVGSGYFGNDPGAPSYGARSMSVAGGTDLITSEALGASVGHNEYFSPGSESLRNMALIGINRGSLVSDGSGEDVQRTLAYFNRLS